MTTALTVLLFTNNRTNDLDQFQAAFERHQPVDEFELIDITDVTNIPTTFASPYVALMTPGVLLRDGWFKTLKQTLDADQSLDAVRPTTILSNGAVCVDVDAVVLAKASSLSGLSQQIFSGTRKTFEFTQLTSSLGLSIECSIDTRVDAYGELDELLLRSTVQKSNSLIAERTGPLPTDIDDFIKANSGAFLNGLVMAGRCNICAQPAAFSMLDIRGSSREQLICSNCHSSSRYRSLARGLLKAIEAATGIHVNALASLPTHHDKKLTVYDTQLAFNFPNLAYPIPEILSRLDWIDVYSSVYLPDEPFGTDYGDNKTNQNLEALTFADATFDIVLTSEVMEHVRNYIPAHQEVARVLKPGGAYIFTVPHRIEMEETLTQVVVHDPNDPSKDEIIGEPEYHGTATPDEPPPLSYRVYGRDILTFLESLGFIVEYWGIDEDFPVNAIIGTELFYCTKNR